MLCSSFRSCFLLLVSPCVPFRRNGTGTAKRATRSSLWLGLESLKKNSGCSAAEPTARGRPARQAGGRSVDKAGAGGGQPPGLSTGCPSLTHALPAGHRPRAKSARDSHARGEDKSGLAGKKKVQSQSAERRRHRCLDRSGRIHAARSGAYPLLISPLLLGFGRGGSCHSCSGVAGFSIAISGKTLRRRAEIHCRPHGA